ncbi:MAG: hypothetical protein WC372_03445 [Candidatus Neomarinimicrobiota bacterium]|jgi:hypothetical protein|nr:hypothetical protein [Candidatus Neomarinimicrobiota bacterium]MDD3965955.1 hypothetical protein [Candidatus Neomarinimicrobiota bacterium]MDX9779470.1 hypothetical protein [bacterium]
MKKLIFAIALLLLLCSCATLNYSEKYEYDNYFERHEPFYTVDSRDDAARQVARKIGRLFRKHSPQSLAILDFSDEYGDRTMSGSLFADQIALHLYRYRNPLIIKRGSINELILERELSIRDLLYDRAYRMRQLSNADYVLHGRIERGIWDEYISLRCFETGSGKVIYAATIRVNYRNDFHSHPPYPPPPYRPPQAPRPPGPPDDDTSKPDPGDQDDGLKKKTDGSGIENVGKINLDNSKTSDSDQYQQKKKEKTKTSSDTKTGSVKESKTVNSSKNSGDTEKKSGKIESGESENLKGSAVRESGSILKK